MVTKKSKIRSAKEIALEKAQQLELSFDEMQRLKEEELVTVAEALARRCQNRLSLTEVDEILGKYSDEDRARIIRYLLSSLADALDLEDNNGNEMVLAVIQHLSRETEVVQSIRDLIKEYKDETRKAYKEMELSCSNVLEKRGISGSAVEPAVNTYPEWIDFHQGLEFDYKRRIEEIKQKNKKLFEG